MRRVALDLPLTPSQVPELLQCLKADAAGGETLTLILTLPPASLSSRLLSPTPLQAFPDSHPCSVDLPLTPFHVPQLLHCLKADAVGGETTLVDGFFAAETLRHIEHEMAETRGRLLAGELEALDARLAEERAAVAAMVERRAAIDERLAQTEKARQAEEESLARDARERERRAGL